MERQKTRLEQLLTPTVEAMGFDVWGIDYSSRGQRATLCLFIDSERGVDVDDCATVSNQIEAVLDVEEVLPRN
ncbi:MAG: ribosome maturation factor RimP, partial [Gammaproteobacteria bacterium]|nr:ribosome maturation factor RimP [Gammaproteobacteria bacterium]